MPREIDPLGRDPHGGERGLDARVGRRHEREHGAVVGRVRLDVEQPDPGHARERGAECLNDRGVPAL